jgi:hypothetical protein
VGIEGTTWRHPTRGEPVVVVAKGRNTPVGKLDRFAAGLTMQADSRFGVIVIDDASDADLAALIEPRLRFLGDRLTLVRHARPRGRMANNVLAIREICTDPSTAIVIVDLDDALVDPTAIPRIGGLFAAGHDVVLAAPFRDARRRFGGDVWIHLRSFAKRLFDLVPDEALCLDGDWLAECEDYATMLPIVELARSPVYVPEYWIWHERTTGRTTDDRMRRDRIIERLLARSPAAAAAGPGD